MSIKILYIEDNPQNMRLVRRMLSGADYDIIEANQGILGLALADTHHPDLVLLDINLPDMEGTEVVRRLKSNPLLSHVPIIALTANAMHGDRQRFLDAGCDGYLAKPVARNELLNTIAYFLENHSKELTPEKENEDVNP